MTNLIVGCGISGITLANLLATKFNEKVLIIDKRNHIGGNCYDYIEENIHVHKYGSHIFHTNNKNIWNYLSQFTKWYPYQHKVLGFVDGQEIPIPFNLNSIQKIFPKEISKKIINKLIHQYGFENNITINQLKDINDEDLNFLYNYVYEKIFKNYTKKQWEKPIEELSKNISDRVPIRINYDDRYFTDKYQGIPLEGYTKMFENMLNHTLISIKLNTDFISFCQTNNLSEFKRIFYSGPIDEFYNYSLGELEYRSLKFDFETIDKKYFQNNSVINYPNNYNWTRIIEFKYFLDEDSDKSIIMYEYPEKYNTKNEAYYPVLDEKNMDLYKKYDKINLDKRIYFIGRLGKFKYFNMDQAIEDVFKLIENLLKKIIDIKKQNC